MHTDPQDTTVKMLASKWPWNAGFKVALVASGSRSGLAGSRSALAAPVPEAEVLGCADWAGRLAGPMLSSGLL